MQLQSFLFFFPNFSSVIQQKKRDAGSEFMAATIPEEDEEDEQTEFPKNQQSYRTLSDHQQFSTVGFIENN